MDTKDKLFALIVVLGLITISVFYEWILRHWSTLKWPALGLLLALVALSEKESKRERLPNYAKARRLFSQHAERHRWIQLYYAAYAMVILAGVAYAVVGRFDIVGFIIHGGLFLLLGALLLPMILLGLMVAHNKEK